MTRRLISRALLGQQGFTLIEVVIATALLTIGIVGVGAMLAVQAGGLSSSSSVGLAAITRANLVSTATMLAQEKIELTKNTSYATITSQTEDYNFITGYFNFKRVTTVTVTLLTTGVTAYAVKTVQVQVFFKPPTESGLGPESSVQLVTLISLHPS